MTIIRSIKYLAECGCVILVFGVWTVSAQSRIDFGNDTNLYARGGECDDPRFEGERMSTDLLSEDMYTDATDCRALFNQGRIRLRPWIDFYEGLAAQIDFGNDTGEFPDDGFCDDPRFEGEFAFDGDPYRDATDCRALFILGQIRWIELHDGLLEINDGLINVCQFPVVGPTETEFDNFFRRFGFSDDDQGDDEALKAAMGGHVCAAFIIGVRQMLGFVDAIIDGLDRGPRTHCPPSSVSTDQIRRIYMRYMEVHPELIDESSSRGVWGALGDAFPCPSEP